MRTFTNDELREIFAEETGEIFLCLLEIDDPTLVDKIYAVNDTQDIISNYIKYTAFPFQVTLPISDGASVGVLQFSISNVSVKLIELVRKMRDPVTVRLKVILASAPDEIKVDLRYMKLKSVTADEQLLTFSVSGPAFLSETFPSHTYSRSAYRALFK